MKTITAAALSCLLLAAAPTATFAAADPAPATAEAPAPLTPQEQARIEELKAILAALKPQYGVVKLPAAKVTLNLGEDYYFLDAADSRRVLVDGWNNPPGAVEGVLGMIFPKGMTFVQDDAWGAVVTHEKTFYVSDKKARSEDYDKVLTEMKKGEAEQNEALIKEGYQPTTLIGWAQPPTYDPVRHDLIWARDIQFGQSPDHTLNYDVRHLGREGVLSMNLVASMSQLPQIRDAAPKLAATAEFDAGMRYADYKDGDKVAGYGLAGLVAAGAGLAVAKKAGLLAILLVVLKKGAVVIVAAFGGVVAWFRRKFGGGKTSA
jgi:uncharacterized membrane-anchored protein